MGNDGYSSLSLRQLNQRCHEFTHAGALVFGMERCGDGALLGALGGLLNVFAGDRGGAEREILEVRQKMLDKGITQGVFLGRGGEEMQEQPVFKAWGGQGNVAVGCCLLPCVECLKVLRKVAFFIMIHQNPNLVTELGAKFGGFFIPRGLGNKLQDIRAVPPVLQLAMLRQPQFLGGNFQVGGFRRFAFRIDEELASVRKVAVASVETAHQQG